MADKETLKKRLEAANFISNNGRVLRTINVLRYKYNELVLRQEKGLIK